MIGKQCQMIVSDNPVNGNSVPGISKARVIADFVNIHFDRTRRRTG